MRRPRVRPEARVERGRAVRRTAWCRPRRRRRRTPARSAGAVPSASSRSSGRRAGRSAHTATGTQPGPATGDLGGGQPQAAVEVAGDAVGDRRATGLGEPPGERRVVGDDEHAGDAVGGEAGRHRVQREGGGQVAATLVGQADQPGLAEGRGLHRHHDGVLLSRHHVDPVRRHRSAFPGCRSASAEGRDRVACTRHGRVSADRTNDEGGREGSQAAAEAGLGVEHRRARSSSRCCWPPPPAPGSAARSCRPPAAASWCSTTSPTSTR